MLILVGDNPERIHSEAAFAKLCGACPIPASSGTTQRHRLNYGGHRQANSALYRTVIVRMRFHQPTIDYVARRTAEGKSKREIIRCLKRYVAREIYHALTPAPTPTITLTPETASAPRRPPISVTISCGAGPSYRSRRRT
jgi:transposase